MKKESIEKIPAIFVMANFEKDQLWRSYTPDLIAFLYQFDDSDWRFSQLHEDYHESNELVYWKQVNPANLEQEAEGLKMLTREQLLKLINDFNPEWKDFYDDLLPTMLKCPHCGEKICSEAEE